MCRASSVPHVVLPKFQSEGLCKLLGVKRLTCFSLISENQPEKEIKENNSWWVDLDNPNDSELIQKVKEFNNS